MTERNWWEDRRLFVGVVLLAALPLLLPPIPPLTDVPGHMGSYRVMLGTDAPTLGRYYVFHWKLIGYLGGELVISALAPLLGLELAVKAMMIAIPVLTATGLLWISREAHGRVQPLAFFALPFAYNLAFQYGFINYTLAMALALNAFALWLRLGRQGRIGLRAALFVPLSCAVWAAHLFGWLVLGLLCFCAEMARQRSAGRGWIASLWFGGWGCLPLAPPAAMFLLWRPTSGVPSDYWQTVQYKPGWLATALVDRWRVFDIASVTLAVCALYYGLRVKGFRHSLPLGIAAATLFALFLIMPFGTAYADARLLPYAIVLGLLVSAATPAIPLRRQSWIAAVGLGFFAVRMMAGAVSAEIESQDWSRRLAAVDHIPHGSRVAAFVTNECLHDWRMQRLNHLPSMAIARKSAFTNDQYDLGTTQTVAIVAPGVGAFRLDPSEMVTTAPCPGSGALTLAQALARFPRDGFDYVWLIAPGPLDAAATRGLVPVWRSKSDVLYRIER